MSWVRENVLRSLKKDNYDESLSVSPQSPISEALQAPVSPEMRIPREFVCGWGAAFINISVTYPIYKLIFRQTMSGFRAAHCFYFLIIASILGIFEFTEARANQYVTCGSVVKLLNVDFNVRLHSHDVKYGTGSGQQSVTGTQLQDDVNSHWVIRGEAGKHCSRGTPVKCGDKIRLTHLQTNKNLHSHYFSSPLSGNQEISAYGDDKGEGDTGDNWLVVCEGEFWNRDDSVMFKHIDTSTFLSATERTYGRPINGQSEVVGVSSNSYGHTYWQAMEGLFIHPSDFNAKILHQHDPSEL